MHPHPRTQADGAAAIWSVAGCHGARKQVGLTPVQGSSLKAMLLIPTCNSLARTCHMALTNYPVRKYILVIFLERQEAEYLVKNIDSHRLQDRKDRNHFKVSDPFIFYQ